MMYVAIVIRLCGMRASLVAQVKNLLAKQETQV